MKKTNNCKYYQALISDAASDEITHQEAFYLHLHLEKCPNCGLEFDKYKKITTKFSLVKEYHKNLEKRKMPSEIKNRIQQNIKNKLKHKKIPKYYVYNKPMITAALLLLLVFGFLFIYDEPIKENNNNSDADSLLQLYSQDFYEEDWTEKLNYYDKKITPISEIIPDSNENGEETMNEQCSVD